MGLLIGGLIILALCAAVLMPLERLVPRVVRVQGAVAATICIVLFLVNLIAMQAVGAVCFPLIEPAAMAWEGPGIAEVALALILGDLLGYLAHRAMHDSPTLWRLHSIHHAERQLGWLEAWRMHPVDFCLHGLAVGLPAAALGIDLSAIVGLILARRLFTAFLHANVRCGFGPLARLLASPDYHQRHHASGPACHFADMLPVWDRLFGTTAAAVEAVRLRHPVSRRLARARA